MARLTIAVARQCSTTNSCCSGMRLFPTRRSRRPGLRRRRGPRTLDLRLVGLAREGHFAKPRLTCVWPRPPSAARRCSGSSFDSGYQPHGEPGRVADHAANRGSHALVLRHREPQPWLVCVHGARWVAAPWICGCSARGICIPNWPERGAAGAAAARPAQDQGAALPGQDRSTMCTLRRRRWISVD